MKLSNMELKHKLILGFGVIIILISVLEYNNISEIRKIAEISNNIYEHPLTVGNSVREIKIEINAMHRWMKDIVLTKTIEEIEKISKKVDESEAKSLANFDIVFNKFLGDPADVQSAYTVFKDWKNIRDEVISLMMNGSRSEAITLTQGKGMEQIILVNVKVDKMINYANQKAKNYKEEAISIYDSIIQNILIYTTLVLILSFLIALFISRSIMKPMNSIISKIGLISKKYFNKELSIPKTNQIGILENSIDQLEILNKELDEEVKQHNKTQEDLEEHKSQLEKLVSQRTEELSDTKELLTNAFDGAAIGMVLVNLDGTFSWVNAVFSNIIGYTETELKKLTFNDITHPEDFDIGTNVIKKLVSGDVIKSELKKRYLHKNGKIIHAKLTTSFIKGKEKKQSYFFTQIQDITSQTQIENKLNAHTANLEETITKRTIEIEKNAEFMEQSQKALTYLLDDVNEIRDDLELANKKKEILNKELEAFSYSVSHDLRAPLRAINGFTNILLEDYVEKLDDEGKRLGKIIQKNAIKMGNLIDDLLEFSRVGRSSMSYSTIDMKTMVNSIYYEASTPEIRNKFNLIIGDLETAEGDPNMIRHVWMNLINNAIKFSSKKEKPEILVECIKENDKLIYSVKDNGAGFNNKYKEKLFGVFQRLHSENEFEGTGVGLALVQRIINRHNGEVWGDSELEKGAKFSFSLPIS